MESDIRMVYGFYVRIMGLPEDFGRRVRGPGPIMPSDIELLVREVRLLKAEVEKIKRALEKHGIKVD